MHSKSNVLLLGYVLSGVFNAHHKSKMVKNGCTEFRWLHLDKTMYGQNIWDKVSLLNIRL